MSAKLLIITLLTLMSLVPTFADSTSATSSDDSSLSSHPSQATVDLQTIEGVEMMKGEWRYSNTRIVEVDFKAPGPDGQPTGSDIKTYDFVPHAGGATFDDSGWEKVAPATLVQRRSTGRMCFNWYRINLTIPDRIGSVDPTGMSLVFDTSIDDYAEVWVNGELSRREGQVGGSVISGWNASNKLVIGHNVKPGQHFQLAIFGINGPISNPPSNFIWMRYAKLDFVPGIMGPAAIAPREVNVEVVRANPEMDAIVGANPKMFKLADGFTFTEGPVWVAKSGYLLFSDPNENVIYKYVPDGKLEVFKNQSGYSGTDINEYQQPGSNGLAIDPAGRLTINEHGNRRVTRLENDGSLSVLADRFAGMRLNSPNDLVYRSDGALFFTDPPFGLPKFGDDPRKELPYSGVFSLKGGKLSLLSKELSGPNGIAFSPDERFLYVGNWDEKRKVVMRYEVTDDAMLSNGMVFFDMTSAKGEDAIDGIKIDENGRLYVSGPGGIWVISNNGTHLGTIIAPMHVHNMAWGNADHHSLYLCARSGLYRMRLNVAGH